ncbi:MAG: helix-turn-helix transcriptional regulator [Candidatus Methylacidiphilales bacterium]|nr:helix-turn-helix transcriptional regulator [Candidatus Methylacidiphilales bacterium]
MTPHPRQAFIDDLSDTLRRLQSGKLRIHVPREQDLHRLRPGFEFHPTPELFLQTGGATDFVCPADRFRLLEGEACIMPRGVPHKETPLDLQTPYGILVCMYDRNGMFLHRGRADPLHRIQGYGTTHLLGLRGKASFRYLDDVISARAVAEEYRQAYIRSCLESFLYAALIQIRSQLNPIQPTGSALVIETEKYVRTHLGDTDLTVAGLAATLGCTPDHLSRQFHRERGIHLAKWIAGERISLARDMLADLRYNVAEIGWACGFSEPSYFIRIFKQHTGTTPRAYRMEQRNSLG